MTDENQNFAEQLAALQRNYASKLQGRVEQLHQHWLTLNAQWQPELLEELHREIHTLAGSSLSYGFKRLGSIVKQLEHLIQPLVETQHPPDDKQVQRINTLFNRLQRIVIHVEDEL